MHSVANLTDPHRSDPAMTTTSTPPIGPYRRAPVQVHQADPHAPKVARRLSELIATRWPGTPAEHVGSSAVPELPGKGIIDLLLPAEPADLPAITQALLELGFQHQLPAAFQPRSRRHARLPRRPARRPDPAAPVRRPQAGHRGRRAGRPGGVQQRQA
jgi:GrpB-like predicted nucleotidyltransferase (UPF0157 family)